MWEYSAPYAHCFSLYFTEHKNEKNTTTQLFIFMSIMINASQSKSIVLISFLFQARFLVFGHKCNNAKLTIESFLKSVKIRLSSEYIIAKSICSLFLKVINIEQWP